MHAHNPTPKGAFIQVNDVGTGISDAILNSGVAKLGECEAASVVQHFLESVEHKAGPIGGAAIRAVHGLITKWQQQNCK